MAPESVIDIVKKYISIMPADLKPRSVWLFGSQVRGSASEDSDIDVAMVFDKLEDIFKQQFRLMKARRGIDLRIEPHPFKKTHFNVQNPFAAEIIRTGIQIDI